MECVNGIAVYKTVCYHFDSDSNTHYESAQKQYPLIYWLIFFLDISKNVIYIFWK